MTRRRESNSRCLFQGHTDEVYVLENNPVDSNVFQGHTDEVYVLENNPVDSNVFLSAGHDGNIILWDLTSGKSSMCHYNAVSTMRSD